MILHATKRAYKDLVRTDVAFVYCDRCYTQYNIHIESGFVRRVAIGSSLT